MPTVASEQPIVRDDNQLVVSDDKDWTWVLDRECPECGFDAGSTPRDRLPALIRESVGTWREVLDRPDAARRPVPATWSPLEYACHARDAAHVFDERLVLMLERDAPAFGNWDQDETAVVEDYARQDPMTVAEELAAECETIAARVADVAHDQWARGGRRSNGSQFTVESLVRYFSHDVVHHVWDVTGRRA